MTKAAMPKARSEGLVIERLGDEMLVYDLEREEAHNLNPVATAVFECCDGATSVTGLVQRASDRLGQEVTTETVSQAVHELAAKLLLADPLPVVAVSRREVVRRAALAGVGVAGAATMIQSIVAPTPAHAQTGGSDGFICGQPCNVVNPSCPSGCTCIPLDGAAICLSVVPLGD
jgi:hypothetical protein